MKKHEKTTVKLWTKDFTIITAGSMISMLGSALSSFAVCLLVLEYTESTFLYALFNVIYMLPNAIVPVICGPFLDRFSRKKAIYTLDFLTSAIYVILAVVISIIKFNFTFVACACLFIGIINSVYTVAYDSLYPTLLSEENYSKGYSVASTIETLSLVMVPLSALMYNTIGIVPIFIINAVSYLIAAIFETQVGAKEEYIDTQNKAHEGDEKGMGSQLVTDFKEGMQYLLANKGLLLIVAFFVMFNLSAGAANAVTLPYFKEKDIVYGEYLFMIVWAGKAIGRAACGGLHYKFKLPASKKWLIAVIVGIGAAVFDGVYLFMPFVLMVVLFFFAGMMGTTSYNIRVSATQQFVPDEKKGRFNGAFNTLTTAGTVVGQLLAGVLADILSIRLTIFILMMATALAAAGFLGLGKKHVAPIYNVEG